MPKTQVLTLKAHGRLNGTAALHRLEEVLEQLRLLHNACLQQYLAAEQNLQPDRFSRYSQQKELTELRAADSDWANTLRRLQEKVIHNVSINWKSYAQGDAGRPRFKTGRYRTIALDSPHARVVGFTKDGKAILRIGNLPTIRLISSQVIPTHEQPVAARVTLKDRRIHVRLSYRNRLPESKNPTTATHPVGIDLGVALSVATSTGQAYRSPREQYLERQSVKARQNLFRVIAAAMATGRAGFQAFLDYQGRQMLTSKDSPMRRLVWTSGEPSKSYLKARRRLSELTDKRAQLRREFRHRVSTAIITEAVTGHADLLAMEDLQVANMTASARGTEQKQGRNVRAKSGINRAILDEAWGETLTMLEYKAERACIASVRVNAQGTSITCSVCGHKDAASRRSQAAFQCTGCCYHDNADHNASVNIADRGLLYFQKRNGLAIEELRLARRGNCPSGGTESPDTGPAGQPVSLTHQDSPINASNSAETRLDRDNEESFAIF